MSSHFAGISEAGSVEQSLKCSVCLDILENPQMLPCGHSLCGEPRICMENILEKQSHCPVCREDFSHYEGKNGSKYLVMPNYSLKSAIEMLRKPIRKTADEQTALCEKHSEKLNLFCKTCAEVICSHCIVESHNQSDSKQHKIEVYPDYLEKFQENVLKKMAQYQNCGEVLKQQSQFEAVLENEAVTKLEEMKTCVNSIGGDVSQQNFNANRTNIKKLIVASECLIQKLEDKNRLRQTFIKAAKSHLSDMKDIVQKGLGTEDVNCPKVPKLSKACVSGNRIVGLVIEKWNQTQLISIEKSSGNSVALTRETTTVIDDISASDDGIYAFEKDFNEEIKSVVHYNLIGFQLTETMRVQVSTNFDSFVTSHGSNWLVIQTLSTTNVGIELFERNTLEVAHDVDLGSSQTCPEYLSIETIHLLQDKILMIHCFRASNTFFLLDLKEPKESPGFLREIQLGRADNSKNVRLFHSLVFVPSDQRTHWFVIGMSLPRMHNNTYLGFFLVDIDELSNGDEFEPVEIKFLTREEANNTEFIAAVGKYEILWQDKHNNTRILSLFRNAFVPSASPNNEAA